MQAVGYVVCAILGLMFIAFFTLIMMAAIDGIGVLFIHSAHWMIKIAGKIMRLASAT